MSPKGEQFLICQHPPLYDRHALGKLSSAFRTSVWLFSCKNKKNWKSNAIADVLITHTAVWNLVSKFNIF